MSDLLASGRGGEPFCNISWVLTQFPHLDERWTERWTSSHPLNFRWPVKQDTSPYLSTALCFLIMTYFFYFMSMGVLPSWICLCVPGARRGDSLELGLQRLVSSYVGAEPGSSGRVVSAPNHQTNSPVRMPHWTFKAGDVLGDFFPCLKLTEYTCSWPGRNKNTWAYASPVSNQTMASKKLAFSWDSHAVKRRLKSGPARVGTWALTVLGTCPTTVQERLGLRQPWVGDRRGHTWTATG